MRGVLAASVVLLLCLNIASAQPVPFDSAPGDALLAKYFEQATSRIEQSCLADIQTKEDWELRQGVYRQQLQEMLGLSPWPERTPLNPEITRTLDHGDFVVEMLQFQSAPGLYVTGNLYRPKEVTEPLPAILYVCGHSLVKENGISYGNKVGYHHHGAWFARHGYVCLTIDTIQLGEIEGLHHGTYREGMWWWASRGYTPAGVEAWNGIRALDYLQSRPEVDPERLGVTGRSGGGAYSWWVAALDERIKCAVPVAGITSMRNHVVDGCIEGHCDCMFMVNTYQWDFPLLAALVAPRPLLISNTDKDTIFPLDGVVDVHRKVKRIYDLYEVPTQLGLQITEGPHKDTQELRIHAFVWFNRFLKKSEEAIATPAEKMFSPSELKVFQQLPADEKVTTAHDWFVPTQAPAEFPQTPEALKQSSSEWVQHLREQSLKAWPTADSPLDVVQTDIAGVGNAANAIQFEYSSQSPYRLPLILIRGDGQDALQAIDVRILNTSDWRCYQAALHELIPQGPWTKPVLTESEQAQVSGLVKHLSQSKAVTALILPRGVGPTEWTRDPKENIHIQRRFLLLGESLDAARAYDVERALAAVRTLFEEQQPVLELTVSEGMDGPGLIAALLHPEVKRLTLHNPRPSFKNGPTFLNVLKVCDVPQLLLTCGQHVPQIIIADDEARHSEVWLQVQNAGRQLGFNDQWLAIRVP